jgi:hypothetical protein
MNTAITIRTCNAYPVNIASAITIKDTTETNAIIYFSVHMTHLNSKPKNINNNHTHAHFRESLPTATTKSINKDENFSSHAQIIPRSERR